MDRLVENTTLTIGYNYTDCNETEISSKAKLLCFWLVPVIVNALTFVGAAIFLVVSWRMKRFNGVISIFVALIMLSICLRVVFILSDEITFVSLSFLHHLRTMVFLLNIVL